MMEASPVKKKASRAKQREAKMDSPPVLTTYDSILEYLQQCGSLMGYIKDESTADGTTTAEMSDTDDTDSLLTFNPMNDMKLEKALHVSQTEDRSFEMMTSPSPFDSFMSFPESSQANVQSSTGITGLEEEGNFALTGHSALPCDSKETFTIHAIERSGVNGGGYHQNGVDCSSSFQKQQNRETVEAAPLRSPNFSSFSGSFIMNSASSKNNANQAAEDPSARRLRPFETGKFNIQRLTPTKDSANIMLESSKTDPRAVNSSPAEPIKQPTGYVSPAHQKFKQEKVTLPNTDENSWGNVHGAGISLRDSGKFRDKELRNVSTKAWLTALGGNEIDSNLLAGESSNVSQSFDTEPSTGVNCGESSPRRLVGKLRQSFFGRVSPAATSASPRSQPMKLTELDALWQEIQKTKLCMEEDIRKSTEYLKALRAEVSQSSGGDSASWSPADGTDQSFLAAKSATGTTGNIDKKSSSNILKASSTSCTPSACRGAALNALEERNSAFTPPENSHQFDSKNHSFSQTPVALTNVEPPASENGMVQLRDIDTNNILDEACLEMNRWPMMSCGGDTGRCREEKVRRELCETEITKLQTTILQLNEEAAVKEDVSRRRDEMLCRITKAWNEATKQWKLYEAKSKSLLDKLQTEHITLTSSLVTSKERIAAYEKELSSSVELISCFKSKLEFTEINNTKEAARFAEEIADLRSSLSKLQDDYNVLCAEKEAATQAASESRKQVIEAKEQLSPLRDRVIELEKGMQTLDLAKQQLAQMEVENSKLKEYTRVLEQREHSSNEYIQNIKQELDETKDCLEKKVIEFEKKSREESDRLHEYYNSKVQEALRVQAQEFSALKIRMGEDHQKTIRHIEKEALRRCNAYKQKCFMDMTELIHRQEKELKALRYDLTRKQDSTCMSHQLKENNNNSTKNSSRRSSLNGDDSSATLSSFVVGNMGVDNGAAPPQNKEIKATSTSSSCNTPNAFSQQRIDPTDSSFVKGNNFESIPRYNTSTPKSVSEFRNLCSGNDEYFMSNIYHASEYDNNHLMESPVRLPKENSMMPTFTVLTDISLQKLVQTLDKSYSNKKNESTQASPSKTSNKTTGTITELNDKRHISKPPWR